MIHVTLIKNGDEPSAISVGQFSARKLAFREAKRAAGLPHTYLIMGRDHGYSGPNGMAWIVE